MDDIQSIENALARAVDQLTGADCPPRLAAALRHAVLAGGSRLRPRLCYAVARAIGHSPSPLTEIAGTAIEFIHSASLVHDDLPCFDNALTRRGFPSVHAAFGESTAILVGDALIVSAFDIAADTAEQWPRQAGILIRILSQAAGSPRGMVAGQGWENESAIDLDIYHQAKTGALFAAASMAGALSVGDEPEKWRNLGIHWGRAYQIIDDLRDNLRHPKNLDKPVGRDALLNRPNIMHQIGYEQSIQQLDQSVMKIIEAIPLCPGRKMLQTMISNLFFQLRKSIQGIQLSPACFQSGATHDCAS